MRIRAFLLSVIGFLFVAVDSTPVLAQAPLPLETLSSYGCDIAHVAGRWTVNAWAAHGAEHDWHFYLANESTYPKAAKSCGKWMASTEKTLKHKS